jgi:N-acyl-D-aspartate/D-glutamate deacylase
MHDLVIRGGRVVDGTGAPAFVADVAVEDGRIVAIGQVGPGRRELNADGLLVTPGFVDIHTHYDAQATWDPYLTPSSWHGVTTVVMGSCGVGFAPAAPDRHAWLIGLMEGVEDIPGAALTEGIQWGWESFPEYLDTLAKMSRVADVGAQIPHGAVRAYVMGDRGAANETATPEDVAKMAQIVEEALRAGAMGFSTSRTLLHRSAIDGEPVPGTFAGEDELFGIGRAIQRAGHGVFQLAAEHHEVPSELKWVRRMATELKIPVMFNLSQFDQAPELWKVAQQELNAMNADGLNVRAQVAGRAIGILMCWAGTAHPFATRPSVLALRDKDPAEALRALRDPGFQQKILAETPVHLGDFETFVTQTFSKMFAVDEAFDYEPGPEQSVAAIAKRTGRTPEEVCLELLNRHDGEGMLYFPLFNYSAGDLDVLHELHSNPNTLMGLSDAGAHCGAVCDGGMPTFMLTHWTRDRKRGAKLPLEYVVQRQTSDTAKAFGLHDRGVLAPGYRADLNLIDYERLAFGRPKLVYDLPAGGRRLTQRASGYVATICAGEVVAEQGEPTGATPGKLLRGPQQAPALVGA